MYINIQTQGSRVPEAEGPVPAVVQVPEPGHLPCHHPRGPRGHVDRLQEFQKQKNSHILHIISKEIL